MKIPTVEYCCGCIDLITAGKVLGWFGIVNGVFFCALLNTKGLDLTRHDLIVISCEFISKALFSKSSLSRIF